ncbi:dynamin family protein [Solibacillus silvestris]|uniref:dynamin family protein n=1 Tax=Solibacillus silvestris TaxID=76853 RepID=UPI003F810B57
MKNVLYTQLTKSIQKLTKHDTNDSREIIRLLKQTLSILDQPPKILVTGETNAGKSHLLNQLIPEIGLPVENKPATALSTIIEYGDNIKTYAVDRNGNEKEMSLDEIDQYILQSKRDEARSSSLENIHSIRMTAPNPLLKKVTLIDTPGFNSNHDEHTNVAKNFIEQGDGAIWLFGGGVKGINSATENKTIRLLQSYGLNVLGVVNRMAITVEACYDDDPERFEQLEHKEVANILLNEWKQRYAEMKLTDLIGIDSLLAKEAKVKNMNDLDWNDSNLDELIDKLTAFEARKRVQQQAADYLQKSLKTYTTEYFFTSERNDKLASLEARYNDSYIMDILSEMKQFTQTVAKNASAYTVLEKFNRKIREDFIKIKKKLHSAHKITDANEDFLQLFQPAFEKFCDNFSEVSQQFTYRISMEKLSYEKQTSQNRIVKIYRFIEKECLDYIRHFHEEWHKFFEQIYSLVDRKIDEQLLQIEHDRTYLKNTLKKLAIIPHLNDLFRQINMFTDSPKHLMPISVKFDIEEEFLPLLDKAFDTYDSFSMHPQKLNWPYTEHGFLLEQMNEVLHLEIESLKLPQRISEVEKLFRNIPEVEREINDICQQIERELFVLQNVKTYEELVALIRKEYIAEHETLAQFYAHELVKKDYIDKLSLFNNKVAIANEYYDKKIYSRLFHKKNKKQIKRHRHLVNEARNKAIRKEDKQLYKTTYFAIEHMWPSVLDGLKQVIIARYSIAGKNIESQLQLVEQHKQNILNSLEPIADDMNDLKKALSTAKKQCHYSLLPEREQYLQDTQQQILEMKRKCEHKQLDQLNPFTDLHLSDSFEMFVKQQIPLAHLKKNQLRFAIYFRPHIPFVRAAMLFALLFGGQKAIHALKETPTDGGDGFFDSIKANISEKVTRTKSFASNIWHDFISEYDEVPYTYTFNPDIMPLGVILVSEPTHVFDEIDGEYIGTTADSYLTFYNMENDWYSISGGWVHITDPVNVVHYDTPFTPVDLGVPPIAQIMAKAEINVRTGPGIDYPVVYVTSAAATYPAYRRDDTTGWFEISDNLWITGHENYIDIIYP